MRWLIHDCKIIERTVIELSVEWVALFIKCYLDDGYEDFPEQATLILNYMQYFLSHANQKVLSPLFITLWNPRGVILLL